MVNKDLLSQILYEAKSYNTFDDIEKLVEVGTDLSMIPIQPLYISLLTTSSDQVALILPKLSSEQRQSLIDLDLWKKDTVDVDSFEYWIEVYSKVQDDQLTQAFVQTEDFLLYLKSRVNIHTFDTEDPMYPDHDNYFLTDDMLLLLEFGDEYSFDKELRYLVRHLYDVLGVEIAYTTLFKLINDSHSMLQEEIYQAKKRRLEDFGFVDYFEALEKLNAFITYKQIDKFILTQGTYTPNIDTTGRNQSLHSSALVSFDSKMENILKELQLVTNESRMHYLHFTFLRLINSTITVHDALRGGRVELTRIGKCTKNCLELGIQKIRTLSTLSDKESIFEKFDFFEVYKIGSSLISIERNRIKKALKNTAFENSDNEYFLGTWWVNFLENSDLEIPKVKAYGAGVQEKIVDKLSVYEYWKNEITILKGLIPFVESFQKMFIELKESGSLHNSFYLNYEIDNIDFEAIMISSFVNHSLGLFNDSTSKKMGVSILELQSFMKKYFNIVNKEYILKPAEDSGLNQSMKVFLDQFGLSSVVEVERYLYGILTEHLTGYEFDTLKDDDFQHIGGPIILSTQQS